jgi:hypothetical protein
LIVVALLAFVAVTTDIFAQAQSPKTNMVETMVVRQTQLADEVSFPYQLPPKTSPQVSPGNPARSGPQPTGTGSSIRQDGYPMLSGGYLPPRTNLNLVTNWSEAPQMVDRLGSNNSGPLSLYFALRFWGWRGPLQDVLDDMQPDLEDMHVHPFEMVDYISQQTELACLWRAGGDLPTLKLLLAGGYPVMYYGGWTTRMGRNGSLAMPSCRATMNKRGLCVWLGEDQGSRLGRRSSMMISCVTGER